MLETDQLKIEQKAGKIFSNFFEAEIKFRPTFKVYKGKDIVKKGIVPQWPNLEYNKKRSPAWCDRVLWRANRNDLVQCLSYRSVEEVTSSDHKPVFATFKVAIRPRRRLQMQNNVDLFSMNIECKSKTDLIALSPQRLTSPSSPASKVESAAERDPNITQLSLALDNLQVHGLDSLLTPTQAATNPGVLRICTSLLDKARDLDLTPSALDSKASVPALSVGSTRIASKYNDHAFVLQSYVYLQLLLPGHEQPLEGSIPLNRCRIRTVQTTTPKLDTSRIYQRQQTPVNFPNSIPEQDEATEPESKCDQVTQKEENQTQNTHESTGRDKSSRMDVSELRVDSHGPCDSHTHTDDKTQ